jgi:hypothetical protein
MGYEPPRDPCRYTHFSRYQREPCPGWHHRPQRDKSYRQAVEAWEQGRAEWVAGTHEELAFLSIYHRKGGGEWNGRHVEGIPDKVYAEDGETVLREVWFETVEQYVRDVPWEDSSDGDSRPTDDGYYRPDWPEDTPLGYCYYETVSEGTPLSPVFATPEELAAWLVGHESMSPDGAARFVEAGWAPSLISGPDIGVLTGMEAINRGAL